jgi:hypothetical protein
VPTKEKKILSYFGNRDVFEFYRLLSNNACVPGLKGEGVRSNSVDTVGGALMGAAWHVQGWSGWALLTCISFAEAWEPSRWTSVSVQSVDS